MHSAQCYLLVRIRPVMHEVQNESSSNLAQYSKDAMANQDIPTD